MEKEFALRIASEIGIDVQQVIREEAELIFLKGLFESPFSDTLVFKGGTALRLLYGSARFSEDLDFSLTGKITFSEIKKIITKITGSDDRFSIKDLISKYYTYLAEIRIKEPWQDLSFPLKIEISKRPEKRNSLDTASLLAQSPATNIMVMTRAVTLDRILDDKMRAIQERKMPRDIFDVWFVCQKTGKEFLLKDFGYPKGRIGQELRKFLPRKFYPIVEELERLNV